jgi:hypothetical protein
LIKRNVSLNLLYTTFALPLDAARKLLARDCGTTLLHRIEQSLEVTVILPPAETGESINATIRGHSKASIRTAYGQIVELSSAPPLHTPVAVHEKPAKPQNIERNKSQPTHFVSIPLGTIPSMRLAFEELLRRVANVYARAPPRSLSDEGVPSASGKVEASQGSEFSPTILQQPERMHVTLLVLSLHTEESLATAVRIVQDVIAPKLRELSCGAGDSPLGFRGLRVMQGNVKKAHVAYVCIDEESPGYGPLQRLVQHVHNAFLAAKLVDDVQAERSKLLHVTIANTKYREAERKNKRWARRIPFDASPLLNSLGDVFVGATCPESLQLNRLSSSSDDAGDSNDGYYHAECSVPLCWSQA